MSCPPADFSDLGKTHSGPDDGSAREQHHIGRCGSGRAACYRPRQEGRVCIRLGEGNFKVLEDGAPQIVRVFEHEDVPVAVGLVVDNSGSMGRKRKEVTAAALAFVRSSNPQDEMFVVNFNERTVFRAAQYRTLLGQRVQTRTGA